MSYSQGRNSEAPRVPLAPPPLTRRKTTPENQPSLLLSQEENQCVFDTLGQCRQSLSTAVAQLLVPTHDESEWEKQETGVVCFVRDQILKSYFIELLSLRTKTFIFRQEIYNEFEYHMPLEIFLTFEGDDTMIGINFADELEASRFREALDSKLQLKKQRKNSQQSRLDDTQWQQSHNNNNENGLSSTSRTSKAVSHGVSGSKSRKIASSFGRKQKKKDKKKGGLSKADIGTPMDFRHVQHVGFDPNKGFDLDGDVDKNLQTFLKKVGVSDQQFKDANTREFIYNFIDQHGGLDAVKIEISSEELPPPPPDLLNCEEETDPPPLPTGNSNLGPPNKTRPCVPPRPLPPVFSPAQVGGAGPPPPPPPPPISFDGPPPPPLAPLRSSKDDKSESNVNGSTAGGGDERSALMMQIQRGISLKKVVAEPPKQAPTDHIGGLASALARSLAERNKAMRLSDSDSSDSVEAEDFEDDEWD